MDTDYIGKWYDDGVDPSLTEFVETCLAVEDSPEEFDFTVEDLLSAYSHIKPVESARFFVGLAYRARQS